MFLNNTYDPEDSLFSTSFKPASYGMASLFSDNNLSILPLDLLEWFLLKAIKNK